MPGACSLGLCNGLAKLAVSYKAHRAQQNPRRKVQLCKWPHIHLWPPGQPALGRRGSDFRRLDQETHGADGHGVTNADPTFPPCMMLIWAQVLSACVHGAPEPCDLSAPPPSVWHMRREGLSAMTPPKSSRVLSTSTVLSTWNSSLQLHSGPRNEALLLPPFYRTKVQGTSLVPMAGPV